MSDMDTSFVMCMLVKLVSAYLKQLFHKLVWHLVMRNLFQDYAVAMIVAVRCLKTFPSPFISLHIKKKWQNHLLHLISFGVPYGWELSALLVEFCYFPMPVEQFLHDYTSFMFFTCHRSRFDSQILHNNCHCDCIHQFSPCIWNRNSHIAL